MTRRNNSLLMIVTVAALGLAIGACNKKDDDKKSPKKTNKVQTDNKAKPGDTKTAPVKKKKKMARSVLPKGDEDYIIAETSHAKKKPNDPVIVNFRKFKVTKASFDPKKVVGGTAEFEIDIASMDSGIGNRDKHLKSDDYFDAAKFTTATVKISAVEKAGDNKYKAKAEISMHGMSATQPIQFEVVNTTDDSVRIKAEHTIKRADFKIGKADGDSAANEVLVKLRLTVKKTS